MDGASDVPADGGMSDPNAMGGAPMDDPNAMGGGPMDDSMGEAPMDDSMGGEGDDSTMSIINQLSDEDRESVRAYAESMLNSDESQDDEEMEDGADMNMDDQGMEDPNMNQNGEQPMMESFIFTKRQLRRINENFGPTQYELDKNNDDRKPLQKKQAQKSVSKKSPFNAPRFDK